MTASERPPMVGVTTPNPKGLVQPEAAEIFRDRVNVVTEGVNVQQFSLAGYKAALDRLPAAVDSLVARGAQAIVVNGTSLSFAFGREHHDAMVSSIRERTGLPVTTMAESMVNGLRALGVERVVLATAYDENITGLLGDFLHSHGIAAETGACMGVVNNADLRSHTGEDIIELAMRAANGRDMDALVISCGHLRTIPLTTRLEADLGVPVVSSALVGVWGALRLMGINDPVPGAGRLFQLASVQS